MLPECHHLMTTAEGTRGGSRSPCTASESTTHVAGHPASSTSSTTFYAAAGLGEISLDPCELVGLDKDELRQRFAPFVERIVG